jgi:hypothetical protein
MRAQLINSISSKVVIGLSLTALLAVLSGYTQPAQPDEGAAAHILSAVNRGAGPDDLTFPRHGGLEAAVTKRAIIGNSRRRFGCRVWSLVSP